MLYLQRKNNCKIDNVITLIHFFKMKKILGILFSLIIFPLNAQIAHWLIPPHYESIQFAEGLDAIITDASGVKTLWSFNGDLLGSVVGEIHPFCNDRAIVTSSGSNSITTIMRANGSCIPVAEGLEIMPQAPEFHNGMLLVKSNDYYQFLDLEGKPSTFYLSALPFYNGYSNCIRYKNWEKKKKPCRMLIDSTGTIVNITNKNHEIELENIEFLSSVNDENIALVIIKHKLYFFDGITRQLSPVYPSSDEINPKNHARIEEDVKFCLANDSDSTVLLNAKYGKKGEMSFRFDEAYRLISQTCDSTIKVFNVKTKAQKNYKSPLSATTSDSLLYGIAWNGEEMLPCQFNQISQFFESKAFVQKENLYGLVSIDPNSRFEIKINGGDDIAFLHQKFETTIRVDIPTSVSSERTFIDIDLSSGCEIDRTSRKRKDTEGGNFIEYNCTLKIPQDLPDETTTIQYPLHILYNGFKSSQIYQNVNAWFYKKFDIEIDNSQTSLAQGVLTLMFNVNTVQTDGKLFPTEISVTTPDTLIAERVEKISETRYKYKIGTLNEGINNIMIEVTEQGCPAAVFPYEIEYHKPLQQTKSTATERETFEIKKKPQSKRRKRTLFDV